MAARAPPGRRPPSGHHDPLDEEFQGTPRKGGYSKPRFPRSLIAVAFVILIVCAIVIVVRVHLPSSGKGHGGPTIVVAGQGKTWTVPPGMYYSQKFTTSVNGTLNGSFAASGASVDVLLMNATNYADLVDNMTVEDVNATGYGPGGAFNWTVAPPGDYYLVAINIGSSHTATVTWVGESVWTGT